MQLKANICKFYMEILYFFLFYFHINNSVCVILNECRCTIIFKNYFQNVLKHFTRF